jgi:hypothetical protein
MTVGSGLYYDFITAWKSGRNPSAIKENIMSPKPSNYELLVIDNVLGSNTLKMAIPNVAIIATKIFFFPNFKVISLTPLNKTPTRTTDKIPQERIIITTGKLVS